MDVQGRIVRVKMDIGFVEGVFKGVKVRMVTVSDSLRDSWEAGSELASRRRDDWIILVW